MNSKSWTDVGEFSTDAGLAPVCVGSHGASAAAAGVRGYCDTHGNIVIQPQFEQASPFTEGMAPVCVNDRWGYSNRKGQLVVQPAYARAYPFRDGHALVEIPTVSR